MSASAVRGARVGAITGLLIGALFTALSPGYVITIPLLAGQGALIGVVVGAVWGMFAKAGGRGAASGPPRRGVFTIVRIVVALVVADLVAGLLPQLLLAPVRFFAAVGVLTVAGIYLRARARKGAAR
jgi:hypothetical protein